MSPKRKGIESIPKTSVKKFYLPTSSSEISCNWKKVLKNLKDKKNIPTTKIQKQSKENKNNSSENKDLEPTSEIWFETDHIFLEPHTSSNKTNRNGKLSPVTKYVAMDCEMVGIGEKGRKSCLARVSIVNQFGDCLYDKYVMPTEEVTSYRTPVSGIRPENLKNAENFFTVQNEVRSLIKKRFLVGHSVHNDLKALSLKHPKKLIRDTAKFKTLRQLSGGRTPSLKKLSSHLLGNIIQTGEHNSVEDAQAAMRIYTLFKKEWESEIQHGTQLPTIFISNDKNKKKKQWKKNRQKKRNFD